MSTASASEDSGEPPLLTRDFALLLAVQLAFGFAFSSFFLLPKYVVTHLGGNASHVGLVGALTVATAVLASLLAGRQLDRGPRRPLIVVGVLLSVATSLAFLGVERLGGYLYALRAVQGVSFGLFYVAAATLVADLAPQARLGQALGWFGAAALLMNAIATLAAERIAHDFGWRAVFVSAAAAGCAALLLALTLREPPLAGGAGERSERDREARPQPSHAATEPQPSRWPVLWASAAGGAAFGVMFTFTQPFALSLGEARLSPLFTGYTASALLVRVAFGSLADRLGRARVAAAALAFYALVVAATAALTPGWLGAVGLAFGLAHGAFYPSLNALALEGASHHQRGTISAYFSAAFNAGTLVVTFCFGHMAQAFGYPSIFLIGALLTASGCPLLWRQTRRKPWLARPLS